jgi:uncharacterized protein (TIGR02118 family)
MPEDTVDSILIQIPVPMFKVLFFARKHPSMTMEQFKEYVLETHVPLVEKIPGLRGYVQNFAVPDEAADGPPYDNVVELQFDSREAYEEGMTSPEAETAIADQENCLAESAVPMVVDESVLRRPKMRA